MEGSQSFTINLTVQKDIFKIMAVQTNAARTKITPTTAKTVYIRKQNPYHPSSTKNTPDTHPPRLTGIPYMCHPEALEG